ncbi:MAG TPA: right-handed parallel beta-helix repeat-containing protein, partial [Pirellulales bacterium]|nr:right-handed parallel beta-helix repeat-containing protein [Pirellulales bacterium]
VNFVGGEIVGRNDVWPDGVNIGGIKLLGASKNIRIYDTRMRDLSSVGIGIFGSEDQPASNVQVTNVVTDNCCNKYGDYVSGRPGPEKGSKREDQGGICFYYVNDWLVEGCRFERSRSDGTHFFRSRRGQFVDNKVYGNKMGGYFIEDCADVLASDNVIRDNGSRGATIERGSHNCTLRGNVIAQSGREGLWAPNCVGLIVTGNFFDTNGRKANGDTPTRIWNANITIDNAPSKTPQWPMPSDYIVADNIITTTADQIAAIRVDADVASGIVIHDNLLRGENHKVLVQGEAKGKVKADDNE